MRSRANRSNIPLRVMYPSSRAAPQGWAAARATTTLPQMSRYPGK